MSSFASISINNKIFLTGTKLEIFVGIMSNFVTKCHSYIFSTKYVFSGGYDRDASLVTDDILQFNKETNKFVEVGKLEQRRKIHSISLVKTNDYTCIYEGNEVLLMTGDARKNRTKQSAKKECM